MVNLKDFSQDVLDNRQQTLMDQWHDYVGKGFVETREDYVCNKYFGGMPIEIAVDILRKHAPEYFV